MTTEYSARMLEMPLLRGFTEPGVQRLIELGQVKEHAAGEELCHEGDPATCVLLTLGGTLRVYVERNDVELVLADVGPGAILGDIAVLCGLARAASVRALEPSAVLSWSAQAFRNLMLGDAFLSQRIFTASLRFLIEHEKAMIDSLAQRRLAHPAT